MGEKGGGGGREDEEEGGVLVGEGKATDKGGAAGCVKGDGGVGCGGVETGGEVEDAGAEGVVEGEDLSEWLGGKAPSREEKELVGISQHMKGSHIRELS